MYSQLNIVDDLINDAKQFALMHDRARYDVFMKTAEEYAVANKMILGGTGAIAMNEPISLNSYSAEFYVDDPFANAKMLADKLYEVCVEQNNNKSYTNLQIPPETIAVESKIRNRLFVIWINGRPMIEIHRLGKYRDVPLRDLIDPVKVQGRFSRLQMDCLSYEIQLLAIYRDLYNPYSTKDHTSYTDLIAMERTIYERMHTKVTGGGEHKSSIDPDKIQKIVATIIKELSDVAVVIGDYAAANLIKEKNPRLQLVCSDIDGVLKVAQNVVRDKLGDRVNVVVAKFDLKIPSDAQLLKYTIYIDGKDSRYSLADVFNSLSYETVPFMRKQILGIQCRSASGFALLRFKLIDVYSLRLISHLNSTDKSNQFIENKIEHLYRQISTIRADTYNRLIKNPFDVFQLDNYAGEYIEEAILAKKLADGAKIFERYYPHKKIALETD